MPRLAGTAVYGYPPESAPVAPRQHSPAQWHGMSMYLYEPDSFTPLARLEQTLAEPAHITLGPDGEFTEHPIKTTHATYFYQNDYLGTPQELVDEEGEIVWLGKYRAWGELCSATQKDGQPAKIRNALRFQGQYCDDETGLHYNLNRYYDPQAGRFINKDPIGLEGGINLFEYAPNSTEWIDPLGLSAISIAKAIAELKAGRSVTVCSYKDAAAVLFGAFPGAQKSAGSGNKSDGKAARDKAAFKSNRQNGSGLASYHMDYQINPDTGVLYGHESLPDGHDHKAIPHINIVTPDGDKVDIFIERNSNCPGKRGKK